MDVVLGNDERALTVKLGMVPISLGVLVEMTPSELGMVMLEKFATHKEAVSASGIRKGAEATLRAQLSRVTGERAHSHREFRGMLDRLIADGLSWLISHALVGPAPTSSTSTAEWIVTTAGHTAVDTASPIHIEPARHLQAHLHPRLQGAVRTNFERGHYALAVFAAFRETTHALGLATAAASEPARLVGLLAGTLAAFGNPTAWHPVDYDDPDEAADIIHLADLLLRITDRDWSVDVGLSAEPEPSAVGPRAESET